MNKGYPKKLKETILSEYTKGIGSSTLANKFNIPEGTIWRWARESSINRRPSEAIKTSKRWTEQKRERTSLVNTGANNPNYKRGYWVHRGYIRVRVDGKEEYLHNLIAANALGRRLIKGKEEAHHLNGNKQDNRKFNLLICSISYHNYLHTKTFLDRLNALRERGLLTNLFDLSQATTGIEFLKGGYYGENRSANI
jgi:hypothetical protein